MIQLRPYQRKCVASIFDAFRDHSSALVSLATGCGKTEIFLDVALNWPGRVMVMAHRDFLVRQPVERLARRGYADVGIEMATERTDEHGSHAVPKIVFTSVQTMSRPRRYKRFLPEAFGLLVIDEAHHATSRTYRRVIEHFSRNERLKLLGVTATPKRADGAAMGQVFETVAFDYGIEPAIDDGWLCPVHQLAVKIEGLDFSKARSLADDFNDADLDRILTEEKPLHEVAAATVRECGNRPTLLFCVTVNHAQLLCAVLNRYKEHSATFISGATPPEDRAARLEAFKRGQIQFLCNCMVFTEGFDAPSTSCVVMARPTKSLALYCQILGRGTRPMPGVVDLYSEGTADERRAAIAASSKPDMMVLDFVGNSGRHRIVTAADLLGGKFDEATKNYARKSMGENATAKPVEDVLKKAASELALETEWTIRRNKIRADAQYRAVPVSPFNGYSPTQRPVQGVGVEQITLGQRWYLTVKLGFLDADVRNWSKKRARVTIAKVKESRGLS